MNAKRKRDDKHKAPPVKLRPEPVIRRNARDRSEIAEKKRNEHITMNFLGLGGLWRALVNFKTKIAPPTKSSAKGTAAKLRAEAFQHYFANDPEKMKAAFIRHLHPRSKRKDKEYCDVKYEEWREKYGQA